jgi:hypothetical protein
LEFRKVGGGSLMIRKMTNKNIKNMSGYYFVMVIYK